MEVSGNFHPESVTCDAKMRERCALIYFIVRTTRHSSITRGHVAGSSPPPHSWKAGWPELEYLLTNFQSLPRFEMAPAGAMCCIEHINSGKGPGWFWRIGQLEKCWKNTSRAWSSCDAFNKIDSNDRFPEMQTKLWMLSIRTDESLWE